MFSMREPMSKIILKNALITAVGTAVLAGSATAGGLADAIVEREPVVIEQTAEAGIPGWVLPAAALVVLGIVVANNDDDDGGDPPQTFNFDPKTGN